MNDTTQVGRLAMRHEGDFWVAYYALPDSMVDPVLLGSIHMGAVVDYPAHKQQFLDLMKEVVADIIEKTAGARPTWDDAIPAPEHEREQPDP